MNFAYQMKPRDAYTEKVQYKTSSKNEMRRNPFEYNYDTHGKFVSEKHNGLPSYAYDALGQLIRVNDPHENATWVYNYDCGGNILSKVRYTYTTGTLDTVLETIPYAYGDSNWKDKLTAYNGKAITYDAIGNPLTDGTWTYQWQAGRQLKQMTKSGMTIQFKYDHNGLRVGKVVNSTETKYMLHGKLVTHMTVGSDNLHFFYDAQSRPAKVSFNGTVYTYIHNLQGDIVGILDSSSSLVVEYKYDAWGKPVATTGSLAATLGKRNPFRYRGYIYDEETELYYLRSRYYNPQRGRFVNVDGIIGKAGSMLAHSLQIYCKNSPVNHSDATGESPEKIIAMVSILAGPIITRMLRSISKAKIVNKKADGRRIITNKEILQSVLFPIPKLPMEEIEHNLGFFAHRERILFSYAAGPNHFVVYSEDDTRSINRWDYQYKVYSLDRDTMPLFSVFDFFEEVLNVPEIGNYNSTLSWLGVLTGIWGNIKYTELPPTLDNMRTRIYTSPEGKKRYDAYVSIL